MSDETGPAFPVVMGNHALHGMTLRDYFAAKAMALVAGASTDEMRENETFPDFLAKTSYRLADAMLKARDA